MQYHIISPHIDDAMLSIGGTMLNLLATNQELHVHYIFTVSNWTNPEAIQRKEYPTDVRAVTEIRKAEEIRISSLAGYTCHFLDFLDMPLRTGFVEADNLTLAREIKEKLRASIRSDDICVFPVGISHPDHIMVNQLGRELQAEGYTVIYYEDMPYHALGLYDHGFLYTEAHKKGLFPSISPIDIARKRTLLEQYESQVSQPWLNHLMNYAYCLQDNSYYERWWKPEGSEITI